MGKVTQKELIMKYLGDYGSITTWQAYADLGITRLASRIFELKKMGFVFHKETMLRLNRYGKKIHFDRYMLVDQDEQESGDPESVFKME